MGVGGGGRGVFVGCGAGVGDNVAAETNDVADAVAICPVFVAQLLIISARRMMPGEICLKATG